MNDFCECTDLKDKNQRIHELEEKICAYKAKVRDLYQVDISDLKKTILCLKERIEELECENERLNKEILEKDKRILELETGFYNISDPDLLGGASRRGFTLMSREQLFRTLIDFDSQITDLKQANEELEDDNKKLESLKQHLLNHVSNKEAEIVNLKEENEKLLNEIKYWKDKYETLDKDSTDGSCIYISIPKGQKVSNFEVHFQEEKATGIVFPYSPIITPTITYGSGTGGDAK